MVMTLVLSSLIVCYCFSSKVVMVVCFDTVACSFFLFRLALFSLIKSFF